MNREDALSVAKTLHTADGLFWPVPVLNMTEQFDGKVGDRVALLVNRDGQPVLAVMTVDAVESLSDDDMAVMTSEVFGTDDANIPESRRLTVKAESLSGAIEVLNYSYFEEEFPDTFRTAMAIRAEMESLGWSKVVAFQTRNPMHRAHEELCRMAMDDLETDGILIHMLLGKLKAGDIPADVRDNSIRTMVDHYFPANTVLVTGYGFDMLYAGPGRHLARGISSEYGLLSSHRGKRSRWRWRLLRWFRCSDYIR